MIFGIDFGTTNTVVSYAKFKSDLEYGKGNEFLSDDLVIEYLRWDDEAFLKPTEINGIKNIKRTLAENAQNLDKEFFLNVVQFFNLINEQIRLQISIGEPFISCVLTVPARFDDIARNAIKSAAIAAGFFVLKLITEPVAASLYALQNAKNGYYLVYDLGGGTFDISLLKFSDGVFQVIAIDGLSNFGGLDVDQSLFETGAFNSIEEARIYKENGKFSDQIAQLIEKALQKTYTIVFNLLVENRLTSDQIKNLILVGGSSRIAMIYDRLSSEFEVICSQEPDCIVSAGAALNGAWLTNPNSQKLLIDAIPFNFGVETLGDKMEVMIHKNAPLPYRHTEYFYPASQAVQINVLQGVNDRASQCVKLASLQIGSTERFAVIFMLDCDGILSVQVGSEVIVVSANKSIPVIANKYYDQLLKLKEKVQAHQDKTQEQSRYLEYLSQALTTDISENAMDWLKKRYVELF